MKRCRIRHVHAAPGEHIRVHRRPVSRPARTAGRFALLTNSLGPVGAVVAVAVAGWAACQLLAFVMGLVVVALKALLVLIAVRLGWALFASR